LGDPVFHTVTWKARDENNPSQPREISVAIPTGAPVQQRLLEWYWRDVALLEDMFDNGRRPYGYVIAECVDPEGKQEKSIKVLAAGMFRPDDTPHDVAWIGAMHLEMAYPRPVTILYVSKNTGLPRPASAKWEGWIPAVEDALKGLGG
jgi:hypothetical protein